MASKRAYCWGSRSDYALGRAITMDLCFVLTRAIRFLSAFGTAVVFALVPTTHVAGAQPLSSSGQTGGAVATFTSPCITIVCGGGTGGTFVPPPWNATGSMSTQ